MMQSCLTTAFELRNRSEQRPIAAMIIEVCVDSVLSATNAVAGGASRLELCGNLGIGGGTTPSLGLFRSIKKAVPGVPIMVMIRPRCGDFLYSEMEFDVMLEDAALFVKEGATGLVAGFLLADGTVDVEKTKRFGSVARPADFCFHRAFDMARNLEEAFNAVSQVAGVTRILTSGGKKSAPEALSVLGDLLWRSRSSSGQRDSPITILPGSGINSGTIQSILTLVPDGLREVHLSGATWIEGNMEHRVEGMGMGVGGEGEWGVWCTGTANIKEVHDQISMAVSR